MGKLTLRNGIVLAGIFLVFNMMIPGTLISPTPAFAAEPSAPEIRINKITNMDGLFDFTITGGASPITFEIGTEDTGAHGPEFLVAGTEYTIEEEPLPSGWSTTVSCTKNSSPIGTIFTPIDGDLIVCTFTNTFTPSDTGDVTKKEQKQAVIDSLTAFKDTDKKKDKEIDKLIRHIEHSLKDKLWEDDGNTPDSKEGKKIFDEEKKAVKELKKALKKADEPLAGVISSAIVTLVGIDKMLAEDAIKKAELLSGDEKELEKTTKEMEKADKELLEKDHPDHAIDHFKHAWEHAQHAIKKAS